MIINSTGSTKVTIGETKEYKTTIDIENLDFIATLLSSNLYSDPEASFIREIVSNGWDSHVEAGTTDTPIVVRLKNEGNYSYNVTIRDYGTGLSKEQFENLFCKIGSSTKRESNAYHGCFGLGHLSPLAVSKVCYINSYYNGVVRLYIMTKDGNNITTNLMSEMPTTEKNGLEITVKNVNRLAYEKAFNNLAFFPNVYIDGIYSDVNKIKIKKFKNFTCASKRFDDKLLLGNVLYPLNSSIIPAEYKDFYNRICTSGIVFNFNIGELQVTPNRESIIYNTKTNELIVERIKAAYKEMQSIVAPFVEIDHTNPYVYHNLLRGSFYFDFLENKLDTEYTKSYVPVFCTYWFNFNITLKGKKTKCTDLSHYARSYFPNLKAVVTCDKVYNEAKTWNSKRLLEENTRVITVPKNTKLSGHLKNYLVLKYPKTVIMHETTLNEYLSEFKDRYRSATGINQEEEFFLTCCYEHLISRTTKKDFESDKDFIAYRDTAKAEAKANKVPASTGRILLTVYNQKGYHYANKREFSNYDSAIKYIKGLKGGTLYKNLDQLSIAETAQKLGYNVISANKKVMEWLSKENFTSKITDQTIYNNKKLIMIKSMTEAGFSTNLPKVFVYSLSPQLRDLAEKSTILYRDIWHYGIIGVLENVTADEDLVKQYKEIMNCYEIYSELTVLTNTDNNYGHVSVHDFLFYIIMKQKKYQINYDCYKKIKQNKILSLICKK